MSRPSLRRRWVRAEVLHAHLSGKFNRSADLLRDQVLAAAARADVITLTEVDRAARGAVLAKIPGWTLTRGHDGPDGESAILTRDAAWRVKDWATQLLDDSVPAARNRIVVVIALLEHVDTGATLLLSAGHLPASVEGSWRQMTSRVVAHLRCVAGWRRLVRQWRRKHRPDGELVVADWNLNLLREWVRAWIRTAWPSMKAPARKAPARKATETVGDLGHRLISWAIGRHVIHLELDVDEHHPASDHAGIRLRYVVGRRIPKEKR